jgi:hypothetical protein
MHRRFEAGKFRTEHLVCYLAMTGMEDVLLTDKHLVVMQTTTLEKRFKHSLFDIASACTKGNGVLVRTHTHTHTHMHKERGRCSRMNTSTHTRTHGVLAYAVHAHVGTHLGTHLGTLPDIHQGADNLVLQVPD